VTNEKRLEVGRRYANGVSKKMLDRTFDYHAEEFCLKAEEKMVRMCLEGYMKKVWSFLTEPQKREMLACIMVDNTEIDVREMTRITDEIWGEL
jgi:hypothetical protein